MTSLGFDIGGTRIKAGLLADDGSTIAAAAEPVEAKAGMPAIEAQLTRLGKNLLRDHPGPLRCVGAAITGPVDPAAGCVYLPGKIAGLAGHRTVDFLARTFSAPCLADNDGNLACHAEWKAGAGRGVNNLVVLTLGTGIGSGVILEGRLLHGGGFLRGTQIGHLVIDVDGPLCLTGASGTGESIASITALVNNVKDHLSRGIPSSLSPDLVDFQKIADAVRSGDRLAVTVFNYWFKRFGTVVLNAFLAYTPERIVLAGGPVAAADLFLDRLKTFLEARAFRYPPDAPIDIRAAELGGDAGWIGAALLAHETVGGKS